MGLLDSLYPLNMKVKAVEDDFADVVDLLLDRPRTRADCKMGQRPCPWSGCRHHLYIDINPETGSIKRNFPNIDVSDMVETCSLDVADRGGNTLKEVGDIISLTRERIRQIETLALRKLNVRGEDLGGKFK